MFKVNDLVKSKLSGYIYIITGIGQGQAVHVKSLDGKQGTMIAERFVLICRNYKGKSDVKAK